MSRSNPEIGDLLFTNIGTLGEVAIVPPGLEFSIKNVALFKPSGKVASRFLYYYLRSRFAENLVRIIRAGSVQKYLSLGGLRQMPVVVPPLPEQRRIAGVLGALDDKIELNRKMNQTLEALAQAIFQSWFIDFDGVPPEDLVESELGLIPRGWEVRELDLKQAYSRHASRGWRMTPNPRPYTRRIGEVVNAGRSR